MAEIEVIGTDGIWQDAEQQIEAIGVDGLISESDTPAAGGLSIPIAHHHHNSMRSA